MFKEYFEADQSAAYAIIEYNNYIYATGTHQDNTEEFRGIYIVKINSFGEVVNYKIFQDVEDNFLSQNLVNDMHIDGTKLYFVSTGFNLNDQIVEYNCLTDEIDHVYSFEPFNDNVPLRIRSFNIVNEQPIILFNTLESPIGSRKIVIQFGLADSTNRIVIDQGGFFEVAHKIYRGNGDRLLVAVSKFEEDVFNSFVGILEIDYQGNIINEYIHNKKSFSAVDIVNHSNGDKVFPYLEFNLENEETRPKIAKIDSSGTLLWDISVGEYVWDSSFSDKWKRVLLSNEEDGYIFCGKNSEFINSDSILNSGIIGKITLEGDSVWYKRFNLLDENIRFHEVTDIERINNGYVASGLIFYDQIIDEEVPFLQSYFIKIDNSGNISGDTTSTMELVENVLSANIKVYPNLVSSNFFIDQKDIGNVQYQLYNSQGKIVSEFLMRSKNQILIIPIVDFSKGNYFLQAISEEGAFCSWKIIKQ